MIDIGWDFGSNDIVLANGDFYQIDDVSNQNGLLLLLKSATNIYDASRGVAVEELFANTSQNYLDRLAANGVKQIQDDGATSVNVTIKRGTSNELICNVNCIY